MKNIILLLAIFISQTYIASADSQSDFCAGFKEGYRMVRGDLVQVPQCPQGTQAPQGSTPYREGVKAGMKAAK